MAVLTSKDPSPNSIFGNKAGFNSRKLESAQDSAGISPLNPKCPDCKSNKLFRDGLRYLANRTSTQQRWLCRKCGLRFTDPNEIKAKKAFDSVSTVQSNALKSSFALYSTRQIGARGAKNLEPVQVQGKSRLLCSGDAKFTPEIRGLLIQFYAYLEKEGFSTQSDYVSKIKQLVTAGANIKDPENVKEVIGKLSHIDKKTGEIKNDKNGTKMFVSYAYTAFLKMLKISWDMPKYSQEDHEPVVFDETELDTLITASQRSKMLTTFLQTLKETFGDPGEVLRITWLDIDTKNKQITIRYPVKNHLTRTLPVSERLLAMINSLPNTNERVFTRRYNSLYNTFSKVRKRTAETQKNPRLLSIDFTAYRTWGGTMTAYYTNGNVLEVQKILGHRVIKNTLRYIGKIDFKNNDLETTSATTVEEILRLGKEGWQEYSVAKINNVEHHCFKRPKRFTNFAHKN
jgi:integrase/transposase-like protein